VPKNVVLLITVDGPGKVYPASGPYSQNSIVVMSVVPDDGASFTGWFGDNAAEVVDNRITMTENKSIIARFAVQEVIPAPVLPQSPPAVLPEVTPEPVPVPSPEVEVPVVVVPEAAPVLPKTSGMPIELFGLLGSGMLGAGFLLRSKKK
jgi:hypothetical protein